MLFLEFKKMSGCILIKDHIFDSVISLVSPIWDHSASFEFFDDCLFSLFRVSYFVIDLIDPCKTSNAWHELRYILNNKFNTSIILKYCGLETRYHLKIILWNFNDFVKIKKSWNSSNLLQVCLSHSFLYDNVDKREQFTMLFWTNCINVWSRNIMLRGCINNQCLFSLTFWDFDLNWLIKVC